MIFKIFGVEIRVSYIGENIPESLKLYPQIGRIFFKDEPIGRHICIAGWSIQATRRPEGFPIKGQSA